MKSKLFLAVMLTAVLFGVRPASSVNPGEILGGIGDALDVLQAFTIGDKEEIAIGSQIHPSLLAQMGGAHPDQKLQSYVNQIGQRLVKASTRSNIPYHFTVVNTAQVNAFAIPGGYVYITKGILQMMRDEAELASVVGHEIGHVVARHGVKKIRTVVVAQKAVKHVSRLGEAAITQLTNLFANLWITGYGRENELEADHLGLHMANNIDYDPNGALRLFKHFLALEGKGHGGLLNVMFASHPPTKKRVDLAEKEIKTLGKKGNKVNAGQYMAVRNRLGR